MPPAGGEPRPALEDSVLSALRRPPCVISFSGGRDSSAVLAVAVYVARREGLPLPVPVTARFPGAAGTDEEEWQVLVLDHLGVRDQWEVVDYSFELDLVGPAAAAVLRSHGVLWPPNTHFHVPVLARAAGGSLLTGIDGDGLFAGWSWRRAAAVIGGRARRTPRSLIGVAVSRSPRPLRRLATTRGGGDLHWLLPTARGELERRRRDEEVDEPRRWDRRVGWYSRQRGVRLTIASLELLASEHDVVAVHPLADPAFLAALAEAGGRTGLGTRTDIMGALFGDLLPAAVVQRSTKATMDEAFWAAPSRDFASGWDGTGVDHDLVDADALRREWLAPFPDARASLLLQSAWLACS